MALLVLAASIPGALWAYRERQPHRDHSRFVDPDPLRTATEATDERWLGRALTATELALADDPDNLDLIRLRMRHVFRLAAVVIHEQHLQEIVRGQAQLYLLHQGELDPDGSFLQQLLREYVDIRLALPLPSDFYARLGTAVHLVGRNDERAKQSMWEVVNMGPLYTELLQFARRYHPPYSGMQPYIEHYLNHAKLAARVQAGATLLEYNGIYGDGAELLAKHRSRIREDCKTAMAGLYDPDANDDMRLARDAALLSLAMLGEPEDRKLLSRITEKRGPPPAHAQVLQVARLWAGLIPLRRLALTDVYFKVLSRRAKELYFRAATHNFARTDDPVKRMEWLSILTAGLRFPEDPSVRVYAMHVLTALSAEHRDVARELAGASDALALFAAALLPWEEALPLLLPQLGVPSEHHTGLIAAKLLKPASGDE